MEAFSALVKGRSHLSAKSTSAAAQDVDTVEDTADRHGGGAESSSPEKAPKPTPA